MKVHVNHRVHAPALCGREDSVSRRYHRTTLVSVSHHEGTSWFGHPEDRCTECARLLELTILAGLNI